MSPGGRSVLSTFSLRRGWLADRLVSVFSLQQNTFPYFYWRPRRICDVWRRKRPSAGPRLCFMLQGFGFPFLLLLFPYRGLPLFSFPVMSMFLHSLLPFSLVRWHSLSAQPR